VNWKSASRSPQSSLLEKLAAEAAEAESPEAAAAEWEQNHPYT
jgi:hypothetical protein